MEAGGRCVDTHVDPLFRHQLGEVQVRTTVGVLDDVDDHRQRIFGRQRALRMLVHVEQVRDGDLLLRLGNFKLQY